MSQEESVPESKGKAADRTVIGGVVLGLLVSGVLLALVFWKLDVNRVWEMLRHADLGLLIVALALAVSGVAVRGFRWALLAGLAGAKSKLHTFSAYAIANTVNLLAPIRIGDVLRARLAGPGESTFLGLFAAVAVERFIDLLVLLAILFASVTQVPTESDFSSVVRQLALTCLAGALVLGGIAVAAHFSSRRSQRTEPRWPRLAKWSSTFSQGLGVLLSRPSQLAVVALYSLAAWGVAITSLWLTLRSLDVDVPIAAPALATVLFGVLGVLPSAPAFVGTVQAAAVAALWPFGVPAEAAVAASLIYQVVFVTSSSLMAATGFGYIGRKRGYASVARIVRRTRPGKPVESESAIPGQGSLDPPT